MARSLYAQHDRLIVVDVEPQHVVVQGAEGAPPYRARCIWAGDSPPLARGDTLVVTNVNPRVTSRWLSEWRPDRTRDPSTSSPNTSPCRSNPEAREVRPWRLPP
jgi:hypothetical protein